jgi:ankyrin repeat protein
LGPGIRSRAQEVAKAEEEIKTLGLAGRLNVDGWYYMTRAIVSETGTAVVKLLLETGKVDADLKDINDRTPLLWATENGHGAVIKLLQKAQHSLS